MDAEGIVTIRDISPIMLFNRVPAQNGYTLAITVKAKMRPVRHPVSYTHLDVYKRQAQNAILIIENDELGMHIGIDFDEMVLRGAENPDQFDAGAFQQRVVRTVGERHFSPVDNALDPDPHMTGMNQVCLLYTSRCV